jgi:hypothetical protein
MQCAEILRATAGGGRSIRCLVQYDASGVVPLPGHEPGATNRRPCHLAAGDHDAGMNRIASRTSTIASSLTLALVMAGALTGCGTRNAPSIAMDADDIAGIVTSASGPEAGVWVIAETSDLPTRFAKIVVTDDQGRYLIPDLPSARYELWVRGYGLADSAKVPGEPGKAVNLTATTAPDAATAAKVYPAAYWYAMMKLPTEAETSKLRNGRNEYLMWVKNMGCIGCHQLGQLSTRTLSPSLGKFNTSHDAWLRRISSGQAGKDMIQVAMGALGGLPLKYLSDWTDRVALGELPAQRPARPQGIERNVVATVRDWLTAQHYLHDLSGTDRRNPTVNGYGPLYGAPELSTDEFPILDPRTNTATRSVRQCATRIRPPP